MLSLKNNINWDKLLNMPLLFRVFNFDSRYVRPYKKLFDGITLCDSKNGNYVYSGKENSFALEILKTINQNFPPIYVALINYWNKKAYIVIPIGEFYFLQSHIFTDTREYNLSYAQDFLEFTSILLKHCPDIHSKLLGMHAYEQPDLVTFVKKVDEALYNRMISFVIESYEEKISHNREIFLFANQYLLIDPILYPSHSYSELQKTIFI